MQDELDDPVGHRRREDGELVTAVLEDWAAPGARSTAPAWGSYDWRGGSISAVSSVSRDVADVGPKNRLNGAVSLNP
jgi:hypothetical protein